MKRRATSIDVIDYFGDRQICDRCGATVSEYGEICPAALDDPCPGFIAFDDMLCQVQRVLDSRP